MKLHVINTGSSGNCYLLIAKNETLILECGVKFSEVKKALNFDLSKIAGAIVTHEHKDHSKCMEDVANAGIDVYASQGTINALKIDNHRIHVIKHAQSFKIGAFMILPFNVKHDCAEPLGFIINHQESGNILFLTDTFYVPNKFKNINNILIEANYCDEIIKRKMGDGTINPFVKDRVLQSHMSLKTCKELLIANDLKQVNKIILIHLSDSNSDAKRFKDEVQQLTLKEVMVAEKGMITELNESPF